MMNVMRLKQSGRHFEDVSFECIVSLEYFHIMILISLKFRHKGKYGNKSSIQATRGTKPLFEPQSLPNLLPHIYVLLGLDELNALSMSNKMLV